MEGVTTISVMRKLTGLGGWLGFFVFTLYLSLFVDGVAMALLLVFHKHLANGGLSSVTFVASILFFIVSAAFEVWFLRLLLKRKKNVLHFVETYLGAQVILNFISGPITSRVLDAFTVNGVKVRNQSADASPLWLNLLSALSFPVLWYFYFQRSRRVQLTLTR